MAVDDFLKNINGKNNKVSKFLTEDDKYRVYKNVSKYPQEFIDLLLTFVGIALIIYGLTLVF